MLKEQHKVLEKEFNLRVNYLRQLLTPRRLKTSDEGLKRGLWAYPDKLVALDATKTQIDLAVNDFNNILKEIIKSKNYEA